MAKKNQNNKSSLNVCEKLRNSINFSAFRRHHGVTNHQQSHYSAPTPPPQSTNSPIKANVSQAVPGQFIPITTPAKNGGGQLKPMFPTKEKRTHDQNGGGVQGNNNGRFSEYITRVRGDMRTSSDLGIERIPTKKISRRDSLNDRVSNFLNRAKIKIRTTSSVGHGNGHDY
ncbi:hypothetical protein LIER_06311 [Lithospermum erythrorhizon]|uniref:Uncharacterized protein n=1 Tax=Lithospermum erythrorhizon TaxID=34254 RepID=A0AAV3P4Q2_LITER